MARLSNSISNPTTSVVTSLSDYRRGLDWKLDLLDTYSLQLQVIITVHGSARCKIQYGRHLDFSITCVTSPLRTASNGR
jgi:hypothetical protein